MPRQRCRREAYEARESGSNLPYIREMSRRGVCVGPKDLDYIIMILAPQDMLCLKVYIVK
jgi:hypothetical protein